MGTLLALFVACDGSQVGTAAQSPFAQGIAAQRRGDDAEAFRLVSAAAEDGDARALALLGDFYYAGTGTPQDYAAALRWYLAAAEEGDTTRLERIAQMHANGQGVAANPAQARAFWQRALAGYDARPDDDVSARRSAAMLYLRGQGVPANSAEGLARLAELAAAGDIRSHELIGDTYFDGTDVPQDHATALQWYLAAAERGATSRLERLAQMIATGQGTVANPQAAQEYWRRALADYESRVQSDPAARRAAAMMHARGQGTWADAGRALSLLQPLAAAGDAAAQRAIGDIYYSGFGLAPDHAAALAWYIAAADAGDRTRLDRIAQMLEAGEGTIANPGDADRYWSRLLADYEARLAQDPTAQRAAANMYARGQGTYVDGARAIALLQPLAANGDARAQRSLGDIYYSGLGVAQDRGLALRWYLAAANAGDTVRLDRVGLMYAAGDGVAADPDAAQYYWRLALADLERRLATDRAAQRVAAGMYARGQGTPVDGQRALALLAPLAQGGDTQAQVALGDMYFRGLGVPQDTSVALQWYQFAAANGDRTRDDRIREILSGLNR